MRNTLSNLSNMFRVPDLRNKVLFTLMIIVVFRVGSNIPAPGIAYNTLIEYASGSGGKSPGASGFLNLFTGGALTRFAVFGLGIMPYITAMIIVQLLGVVIPKFEQWRDEGATGEKKLTQTTRYMSLALGLLQSTGLAYAFHSGSSTLFGTSGGSTPDFLPHFDIPHVLLIVLTMTAGTGVAMWMSELITQRGVGQGASVLIFTNVVAGIPGGGQGIWAGTKWWQFALIVIAFFAVIAAIVFIEQGQRRIPVTFAKRVVGRRMYGGQTTYIPMKVNTAGVVPIIFATSVMFFPTLLSQVLPNHGTWETVQNWVNTKLVNPSSIYYIIIFGLLIFGFAYFYAAITFDSHRHADQIRKQGGYIPGIRPGPPTERHLQTILNRVTFPGALWVCVVAEVPALVLLAFHVNNYPFAGVTLLIAGGVCLETMKQIDSQLMMRNYEGFLK